MKTHLERMIRYMAWAARQSLAALRGAPAAQAETLPLLAHLLAAEHIWLARLEQRETRYPVWPTLTADECEQLAGENETGYRAFLGRLGEGQLGAAIRYRNTRGQEFATPVLDILTHVVIHGAYHRGQIARAIGRSGGTAVNTDFITFVREVEPTGSSTA
jgi:uncharacterized damage-inducible protein DinB